MKPLELEEFMHAAENAIEETPDAPEEMEDAPEEIDVQKAVVEELASEKVKMESEIESLSRKLEEERRKTSDAEKEAAFLKEKAGKLENDLAGCRRECERLEKLLDVERKRADEAEERQIDTQERNPNFLALLDRDQELPDRFPGETRDHVIDVVEEAWKKAEEEGCLRKAQVLEGVLASNERNGTLAGRRAWLEKLFSDNMNIVNGTVIAELEKAGISHKKGEEYLTPGEIMARNF